MPKRVQTIARGLRQLLGRGDPVDDLLFWPEQFQPTLDLEKFLQVGNYRTASLTEAASAIGGRGNIPVPAGELWLPLIVQSGTDVLDADQTCIIAPAIRSSGVGFTLNLPFTIPASTAHFIAGTVNPAVFLDPGAQRVFTSVDQITVGAAGSIDITTSVLFVLMQ